MTHPQIRVDGLSLADVVERLRTHFEARVSVPVIVRTVRRCRRDLDIAAEPLVPERVERLAYHRLSNIAAAHRYGRRS